MPLQLTRGERNNNPGNIVFDPHVDWQGQRGIEQCQAGETPRFASFDTPENGIRAVAKILRSYFERDGIPTLRGWLERWAPASDHNDVAAYVADAAAESGINPDQPFNAGAGPLAADYAAAVRGIVKHENGRVVYTAAMLQAGIQSAFT